MGEGRFLRGFLTSLFLNVNCVKYVLVKSRTQSDGCTPLEDSDVDDLLQYSCVKSL